MLWKPEQVEWITKRFGRAIVGLLAGGSLILLILLAWQPITGYEVTRPWWIVGLAVLGTAVSMDIAIQEREKKLAFARKLRGKPRLRLAYDERSPSCVHVIKGQPALYRIAIHNTGEGMARRVAVMIHSATGLDESVEGRAFRFEHTSQLEASVPIDATGKATTFIDLLQLGATKSAKGYVDMLLCEPHIELPQVDFAASLTLALCATHTTELFELEVRRSDGSIKLAPASNAWVPLSLASSKDAE